jgi:serine phosphatase RsbU (regulator of sigma subunit)
LQKAEIAQKDLENKRQRILIASIGLGFVFILLFSVLLYKQFRAKKKANALLRKQNIEIKNQRDQIFEQKKSITDSIRYASKIQNAVLPPFNNFKGSFTESFLFFKPKDIVSGDFYWVTNKNGLTVIAAVDCTGHGVPGAFMSMLGVAFLNEIVNAHDELVASKILDELRNRVVTSLHQTGKAGETQDGMDLALCIIDNDNLKVQFAGAFNPLIVSRNKELDIVPGDKMPIGIYRKDPKEFSNNIIDIERGDTMYIFSDGFADQFGGNSKRKYLIKNFREFLRSISDKPLTEQKELVEQEFESWKGDYRQIDDVLVIGFRI